MTFTSKLAELRLRWDPRAHPLSAQWRAGELSPAQLVRYLEQHRWLVAGQTQRWERAAACAPQRRKVRLSAQAERQAEVEALWVQLVAQLGGDPHAPADAETGLCGRTWAASERRSFPVLGVGLYVIHDASYVTWEATTVGFPRLMPSPDAANRLAAEIAAHDATALEALGNPLELSGLVVDEAELLDQAEAVLAAGWLPLSVALRRGTDRPIGSAG